MPFVNAVTRRGTLITSLVLSGVALVLGGCEATLKDTTPNLINQGLLTLSQSAVTYTALENQAGVGTQQILVEDVGGLTVPAIQVGTISYSPGAANWVFASLDNGRTPATLTVTESPAGLPPGVYVARVPIYSDASLNSPQNVVVTMEVVGRPVIGLSPDSVTFSAVSGGGNPPQQSVHVTNIGSNALTGLNVAAIHYATGQPAGWLAATVSPASAPATLDLQATTGTLSVGSYRAAVVVASADTTVAPDSIGVTFTVSAAPLSPRIAASPSSLTFSAQFGGANPASKAVTITNSGGGSLTGLMISNISYGVGGADWITTNLSSTTAPATLTIQPSQTGLAPGLYTAAVELSSATASNNPINISVSLNVSQQPAIGLSPASISFTGVAGGNNPGVQSVSLTNAGGGTLNQLSLGSIQYAAGQPTGWLQTQLVSTTAPTTVNLRPVIGSLGAGTYTALVPITSAIGGVNPAHINVTLNIGGGTGSLVKLSGDGQSAFPDSTLSNPLIVRVYDANGNPASGVTTAWAAAQGTLSNIQAVTNSLGEARATWRLGPQNGLQTVQVTTNGLPPVTFTASALTAPGANPGEPAGFSLISDRPFDAKVEDGWQDRGDVRFTINQDPTAPKSPQNVGVANWPTGFNGGVGPINTYRVIGQYNETEIYISFWIKLSSNWVGAPSNGINKIFHIWINGGSVVVFSAQGASGNPIVPQMRLQNVEDDPRGISFNLNPNIVPGARMIRGQWHRVEVLLFSNTPGSQNGRVAWWLDGVQIADYTNVGFISPTNPIPGAVNWQQVSWNPTWGAPADQIPAPQTIEMDHIYISGHH